MNDADNTARGQRPNISGLVIVVVSLGVLSLLLLYSVAGKARSAPSADVLFCNALSLLAIFCLAFGALSLFRRSALALTSVSLCAVGLFLLPFNTVNHYVPWPHPPLITVVQLLAISGLVLAALAFVKVFRLWIALAVMVITWSFCLVFSLLAGRVAYSLPGKVLFESFTYLVGIFGLALGILRLIPTNGIKSNFREGISAVIAIVLASITCGAWFLEYSTRRSFIVRDGPGSNLSRLSRAMWDFASDNEERYPDPNGWCDLLLEGSRVTIDDFLYPSIVIRSPSRERVLTWPVPKKGKCHYAMNPHCKVNSPLPTVLLFEAKEGWNQFGGPELLSTHRHEDRGCLVLYNDGQMQLVRAEGLRELDWGNQTNEWSQETSNNSRNLHRPAPDRELKYWLKNMVWHHRFTNEEVAAATGFTEKEIEAAKERFNIRRDNRPERQKDAPLLVLPYPGGRHPRIGFLEGAIDPQRETKFSVFAPWDPKSYVVVDLPEAIWSNLGLTYLAHTHIDTIWTKQGIELPELEWNRHPGGRLDIERELPNGITFGARVEPTREAVRMEMWLKNGTKQKLSDLRTQICVMPKMAAGFAEQTNDNKVFRDPYAACRSTDGKRWIITAWENCHRTWGNARCPCFHSDPKFPDLEPGQMHRLQGWLSFYEGTDIEAELRRIEQTNWRR